jgi:hypothetical protein
MWNDATISTTVGELAQISSGYPLRVSAEELEPGDVAFVQLKNVGYPYGVAWKDVANVALPSKREPAWLSSSDVLFSSRGTKTLAYPIGTAPKRAVCGPQFFVITVSDSGSVLPEFLAWQINQRPAQDYLQRESTGSFIQNIRKPVLEQMPIALPPLEEQRLIVQFWRAAQREREIFQQLIEATDAELDAIASRLAATTIKRAKA